MIKQHLDNPKPFWSCTICTWPFLSLQEANSHSQKCGIEKKKDMELIYKANTADIEALEDARFTLSAIQKADTSYDEMINESIRLIDVALGINFIPAVERLNAETD